MTKKEIKEIIHNQELPYICVESNDIASGTIIKSNKVVVQAKTIKECEEVYNRIKDKK